MSSLPLDEASRNTLTDRALASVGVQTADVLNLVFENVFLNTNTQSATTVLWQMAPGTEVIGEIENDPLGVIILSGELDIAVITTTTETNTYRLSLTGDLAPGTQPAPIPEPATVLLLGTGVGALAARRWRPRGTQETRTQASALPYNASRRLHARSASGSL